MYYTIRRKPGGKLGRILELILEMLVLHHTSKVVKQNLDIESAVYEAAAYFVIHFVSTYPIVVKILQKNWQRE